MTGLLLATLLNLSPGIQLADNVEARNVALSEARLPLLFVSDDDGAGRPSLDVMTREQLANELRRLDDTKPGIVGPIVLMAVGGPLVVVGGLIVFAMLGGGGFSSSGSGAALAYLIVGFGGIVATVGIILAIVGSILLAVRAVSRGRHSREVEEVQRKIDDLDQTIPTPPPPPGPDMLPPPPPPPPQANFVIPGRLQTVMTF